ncbi:sulfatase-like hydrolase/transferase [Halostella sp. JP-L12]|uniref:sulfatase-like hydrolase/transferase n=1 Tax=Halostella TaxID=1843185 RepID=UPI000EF76922|nr:MULTISPECIES: sulfatase-like hydrolase/transferase [Halostella]NHN46537.1 sulfatase-like hydrolase/transferase [Halostella sp. JP-L12]
MNNRNIIVICLDTVRKDYFDEHADRLVSKSDIIFSQCRAPSSWTVPSHASFFTGQLPHEHGCHAYDTSFQNLSTEDTFLSSLKHRTIGVSANPYFSSSFGAASLFDEFVDIAPSVVFSEGIYLKDFSSDKQGYSAYADYVFQALDHEHSWKSLANGVSHFLSQAKPDWIPRRSDDGGRAVKRAAVQSIDSSEEPYFLFLNFMDAHAPFSSTLLYDRAYRTVPWGWSSQDIDFWGVNTGDVDTYKEDINHYRQLYSASIAYLDRLVTNLVDMLTEKSSRETTVVITADHGENLVYPEDDNLIEHKGSLSEGLLHVPLTIINPPSSFDPPQNELFSLLDLGPLVSQLLGIKKEFKYIEYIPSELIGLGSTDPHISNSEFVYFDRSIRCCYKEKYKYIWDSQGNRYLDLIDPTRPNWRHRDALNVEIPEWAKEPFVDGIELHEVDSRQADHREMTKEMTDRLQNLGYL